MPPTRAIGRRRLRALGVTAAVGAAVMMGPAESLAQTPGNEASPLGNEDWTVVETSPIVIESIEPASAETVERIEQLDAERSEQTDAEPFEAARTEIAPRGAAVGAGFVTTFDANVPPAVRDAAATSVAQWGAALNSPVPVVVQVSWVCLGDAGLLGYAGSSEVYQRGDLPTQYGYPTALANALTGVDLNGGTPEVRIVLNAELADTNSCTIASGAWHTDDTPPPSGKLDMRSVVVHEVAHGLGFLGSAWREPSASPRLAQPPYRYDSLVYTQEGPLLTRSNPDAFLGGTLSIDVGGGRLFGLHSPGFFTNGSSFSHFATAATSNGAGGSLMVPQLERGIVRRSIDAAVLGVLDQQGWTVAPAPVTPTVTGLAAPGTLVVDIDPSLDTFGAAPVAFAVEARRAGQVDAGAVIPAGQTSVTLSSLYNGITYDIAVTPIGRTANGIAAQTGVAMPAIPNQPLQVLVVGSGLTRTVSWAEPVGATGGDVYRVERRRTEGGWTTVGDTTSLNLDAGTLTPGIYQFRITAVRNGVAGPPGSSLLVGIGPGVIRPLPLDGQVARMFAAYFQREPDPAGYAYWMRQLAIGTSLSSMSAELAISAEFQVRYGVLDNPSFVDLVYRNALGRPADGPGRSYWVAQLAAGRSRGDVMLGFAESPEHIATTQTAPPTTAIEARISRLYFAFFLREPDAEGLAFWTGLARRGTPLNTIAQEMAVSAEFVNRYGTLSNTRFVELVYNNVLTRPPDPGGQSYWTGQLATSSRGTVMTGFSESLEFILRTGTQR